MTHAKYSDDTVAEEVLADLRLAHQEFQEGDASKQTRTSNELAEVTDEPLERIERLLIELQASGHVRAPQDPVTPGEWMIAIG